MFHHPSRRQGLCWLLGTALCGLSLPAAAQSPRAKDTAPETAVETALPPARPGEPLPPGPRQAAPPVRQRTSRPAKHRRRKNSKK